MLDRPPSGLCLGALDKIHETLYLGKILRGARYGPPLVCLPNNSNVNVPLGHVADYLRARLPGPATQQAWYFVLLTTRRSVLPMGFAVRIQAHYVFVMKRMIWMEEHTIRIVVHVLRNLPCDEIIVCIVIKVFIFELRRSKSIVMRQFKGHVSIIFLQHCKITFFFVKILQMTT